MIRLYHGSTVAVRKPSLRPGRSNADSGKGFYTTSNLEQADRWAHIKQEREEAERAVVSFYEFDETLLDSPDLIIRRFTGADEPWLYFVADCRQSRPHDYDLVQGPVANDKVFTTVNLFESGVLLPSDGNMLNKNDETALVDWMIQLFRHVRGELMYKDI